MCSHLLGSKVNSNVDVLDGIHWFDYLAFNLKISLNVVIFMPKSTWTIGYIIVSPYLSVLSASETDTSGILLGLGVH